MLLNKSKSTVADFFHHSSSIIGVGVTIMGDIKSEGDVRIDGKLIGNLKCSSKVVIGPQGIIEGDLSATTADIFGTVRGKIKVEGQLNLKGKSLVEGDIFVATLQIESSVCFNGKCHMGASIVDLNQQKSIAINE